MLRMTISGFISGKDSAAFGCVHRQNGTRLLAAEKCKFRGQEKVH